MNEGALSPETARLVRLSGALASGERRVLLEAMEAARDVGDPEAVEEVLLQSYLFLGYPATLHAFRLWREVSGRPAAAARVEGVEERRARGERVFREVYGGQHESVRRNVSALHADLGAWMIEEGYGKVLAREGLSLMARELCIVAILAVANRPDQLHSHLRGALAVGAPPEAVEAALEEIGGMLTREASVAAWDRWREVSARWKAGSD